MSSGHACSVSNKYAARMIFFAIAFLSSVRPASAKVIYTAVDVTIGSNTCCGYVDLDLSHDGISDFKIQQYFSGPQECGDRMGDHDLVSIVPAMGNGIVDSPALLPSGVEINSNQKFQKATTVFFGFACLQDSQNVSGYLGLEFKIEEKTHYGWAHVKVAATGARRDTPGTLHTTLIGFAYETIPGRAIKTGETSSDATTPDASNPDSSDSDASSN